MKLKELASRLALELNGDGEIDIFAPVPIEAAGPGTIIFVASEKYLPIFEKTSASCAVVPASFASRARCATLTSSNPYYDFARILEIFFPAYRPPAGIDPTARIAEDVKLGDGASVGAYCTIANGVTIGRNAVIHPHATIYPNVTVGDDFVCHSHASIREGVIIGNRVTLLNGAVLGADGFGFGENEGELFKIPQVGTVVIQDDVEIGANSTVDRATMGATIIHRGVKLDNLVHIGHNCEVGDHSRFAAHVGLAGSVRVGSWCQFGGQSGCADHAKIGDRVMVVGQTGIPHDVADNAIIGGTPAVDVRQWRRYSAALPRLPELLRRMKALEERVRELVDERGS